MDDKYIKLYESLTDEGKKIFDKLPEERQELVSIVIDKLNAGGLHWEKGWIGGEMYNPVTGVHYKGVNAMFLSLRAEVRSYSDSRWVTFNQMVQKGWSFKKDDKGNSMGKGAGTPVEYFTFYDKLTKKPIDWKAFKKLSKEEQTKYWQENIRSLLRTYTVFNCSLMDGVPELKMTDAIKAELNEKAETIIRNSAAPVSYDGHDRAYYRPSTDSIHLPARENFVTYEEFLGTALHEIGHSTGHHSRLNRDMGDHFGGERYASEELNAEIFSLFEQQALDVKLTDGQIENHSAYLEGWSKEIRNNPNFLFVAIANAQKMVSYVNEYYLGVSAVNEDSDELLAEEVQNRATVGETVGETAPPIFKNDRASTQEGQALIEAIENHNNYAFLDADKLDENKVFNNLFAPTSVAMKAKKAEIDRETVYLADREYMPKLNILWSENSYLEKASYDLNYGNSLLSITNEVIKKNHPHSGYDKTDFQILFKRPGEPVFDYRGRYDVGCEDGDVIHHIEENARYYIEHPEYAGEMAAEIQKSYEPILKAVDYLKEAAQWGYEPKQGLSTLDAINQKIEDLSKNSNDEYSDDGWAMSDADQMEVLYAMRDYAMQEAYSPAMLEQMQGMKPRNFTEPAVANNMLKNTNIAD